MNKEAIILAGGFGTRLKDTIPDLPKCLAPVKGQPLLYYIITYLLDSGVDKIIFSLFYKSELVIKYLNDEFEPKLKKLSRKQGQILVKLIYRQTGQTTFDLIKNYKSGWKAFWSSNTAKLFNIDLKKSYEPMQVPEDFYIESYLIRAFDEGKLVKQEAKKPISESELRLNWAAKNRQKAKL